VAVLEEERRRAAAAKQVENEAKTDENKTKRSPDWLSSKTDNELNMNNILKKETQDSSMGNLDLGLCLKGHDGSHNSVGEKVDQVKPASLTGFWAIG
ncbi:hypothetical protein Gorai_022568, partial [Gossypium raimondii]|nr:hypothetical protein [Gossypium raimondii]